MRIIVRSGLLGAALLLASFGAAFVRPHHLRAAASPATLVSAGDTPHVTIFDSNSPPYNPIDGTTGGWGYAPNHVIVTQGQQIVFDNPASNFQPHTVTSLVFSQGDGGNSTNVVAGTLFDSSPTRADRLAPGTSWTLDTSNLKPGQYEYYCSAHPWMLGSFTVLPASSS
jgi:plastocyanin